MECKMKANDGVIVECFENNASLIKHEKRSCSGIYLGNGLVLTSGIVAADILKHPASRSVLQGLESRGWVLHHNLGAHETKCFYHSHNELRKKDPINHSLTEHHLNRALEVTKAKFNVFLPVDESLSMNQDRNHSATSSSVKETTQAYDLKQQSSPVKCKGVSARIERLFYVKSIGESIEKIMPSSEGWRFTGEEEIGKEGTGTGNYGYDFDNIIMSTFIVLKMIDLDETSIGGESFKCMVHLVKKMLAHSKKVFKGATVYIESSPFGSLYPDVFLNSLSRGIICNAAPPLLLTDARSGMGCEGAPVFTALWGNLCAMVIAPFFWKNNQWLGITLLAAIQPILDSLLQSCGSSLVPSCGPQKQKVRTGVKEGKALIRDANWPKDVHIHEGLMETINRAVVGVLSGDVYGSGVVVSSEKPPLILTNAHVINSAPHGKVVIVLNDGKEVEGQVVYSTRYKDCFYFESLWDIAVISVSKPLPQSLPLSTRIPPAGTDTFVMGCGLFHPKTLSHSITSGEISRVYTVQESMIWPSYPHLQPSLTHQPKDSTTNHEERNNRSTLVSSESSNAKDQINPMQKDLVAVMIQTTCRVFQGASGGPLISIYPKIGPQVVGIATCNVSNRESKIVHPEISLIIPTPVIAHVIDLYKNTQDPQVLTRLDVSCPAANHLWNLSQAKHNL